MVQDIETGQVPGAPRRLFLGILLSWLSPTLLMGVFVRMADLVPPFDTGHVAQPGPLLFALVSGLLAAGFITWRHRCLRRDEREGRPAEEILAAVRRVLMLVPVLVFVHVAAGAVLLVFGYGRDQTWSDTDLAVALVVAVLIYLQMLVPLGLVCMDEFGVAFGHLVEDRRVIPGYVRSTPVLLLSVMIALVLPVQEYLRTGAVSPEVLAMMALLVVYALVVTGLNLRYTADAMYSMRYFVRNALRSGGEGERMDPARIRPQALDDVGVLISGTRRMLERLEQTRIRLEESESRIRSFAESSSDWFFELDEALVFRWVSGRLQLATGVVPESLIGESAAQRIQSYDPAARDQLLEALTAHRAFRGIRTSIEGDDGKRYWVEISAQPVHDARGRFVGYRGTGSNVSELVEVEARLRAQDLQLVQAQKMEAVGQLTGGIAHDFNNLLTAVAGNLELLQLQRENLREDPLIGGALGATRRAGALVQRLLAFSRRQELRPESVDLVERIEGMAELLRRTLGVSVVLEVRLDEAVQRDGAWSVIDPAQFESALLNLALNARDAMPGGGRLQIAVAREELGDDDGQDVPEGRYVTVRVSDTGTGIEAAALAHVFEPFFSTKEPGAGSGLGLSMVYGFARQSGGTARIESSPGVGTSVTLLLPSVVADASRRQTELQAVGVAQQAAGARVLVVEDEASVRAVVRAALERLGCSVELVGDGDAALERLQRDDLPLPELVLSDVVLPGSASGVDVIRAARARSSAIRCVLMSGYAREYIEPEAADIRALPMLSKPFRLEELETLVRKELAASRDRRAESGREASA